MLFIRGVRMKSVIISFSETFNNERVASQVARDLNIDWIKVEETKRRSLATNIFDVIFARKPKIALDLALLDVYDFIVFIGPIWLGQVTPPFRRIFKYMKQHPRNYGYITVCGGNQDVVSNPKIRIQLEKRIGVKPKFIQELKLFDLMPEMSEKDRNEKMFRYEMNKEETIRYVEKAKAVIEENI